MSCQPQTAKIIDMADQSVKLGVKQSVLVFSRKSMEENISKARIFSPFRSHFSDHNYIRLTLFMVEIFPGIAIYWQKKPMAAAWYISIKGDVYMPTKWCKFGEAGV